MFIQRTSILIVPWRFANRRVRSLVDVEPEDVRPRVVSRHVEVELAPGDGGQVKIRQQGAFLLPEGAGDEVRIVEL